MQRRGQKKAEELGGGGEEDQQRGPSLGEKGQLRGPKREGWDRNLARLLQRAFIEVSCQLWSGQWGWLTLE